MSTHVWCATARPGTHHNDYIEGWFIYTGSTLAAAVYKGYSTMAWDTGPDGGVEVDVNTPNGWNVEVTGDVMTVTVPYDSTDPDNSNFLYGVLYWPPGSIG